MKCAGRKQNKSATRSMIISEQWRRTRRLKRDRRRAFTHQWLRAAVCLLQIDCLLSGFVVVVVVVIAFHPPPSPPPPPSHCEAVGIALRFPPLVGFLVEEAREARFIT